MAGGQVVELVAVALVVVDQLHVALADEGEEIAPVVVWIVDHHFLRSVGAGGGGKVGGQVMSVVAETGGTGKPGNVQEGNRKVPGGNQVGFNAVGRNGDRLLEGIVGVDGPPADDHRDADATLPLRPLHAAHRKIAVDSVRKGILVGGRTVAAVVTNEDDQGVLRHAEVDQLLADLSDGNIHPLDHGGELGVGVAGGRAVVARGVGVGGERGVDGVEGHVEKEGNVVGDGILERLVRFDG